MSVSLKKILETNKIQQVKLRSSVLVEEGTPIKEVIEAMRAKKRGCAIIQAGGKTTGIFTERDLLTRVIEPKLPLSTPIKKVMTPNPGFLPLESSVASVVLLMSKAGYRHVPLTDEEGNIKGFASVRDILDFLAEHFPHAIYNLPPDPNQTQTAPEGA